MSIGRYVYVLVFYKSCTFIQILFLLLFLYVQLAAAPLEDFKGGGGGRYSSTVSNLVLKIK